MKRCSCDRCKQIAELETMRYEHRVMKQECEAWKAASELAHQLLEAERLLKEHAQELAEHYLDRWWDMVSVCFDKKPKLPWEVGK